MPRTDQVALVVERALGQVRAEVAAATRHREQLTSRIADGEPPRTRHRPRRQTG